MVLHFVALRKALDERCTHAGVRFAWFFEEVGTMTAADRATFSEALGSLPVAIQSADYGWCHRLRFYWGLERTLQALLNQGLTLPFMDLFAPGELAEGCWVIRWTGAPMPSKWTPIMTAAEWRCKQAPSIDGSSWRPSYSGGRFRTLTPCWVGHPAYRGWPGAESAMEAFEDDDRRYPLAHYEKENLLFWKKRTQKNRSRRQGRGCDFGFPLPAADRETLMSLPESWTRPIGDVEPPGLSDTKRCHAIGNGWHIMTT